jgi:Domain of unknown function (DUF4337)
MSEDHFHVHGAHDHAVEHAAHEGPGLGQQVAIFTALMSTVGAIISYQGGATQNEAMLYKNEAVLQKSLASDQWNFYQSKSTKGHLMEMAGNLAPPDKQAFYREEAEKYRRDKDVIKTKAEELEKKYQSANQASEKSMQPHHHLAQAMTLIQIAISLASVTALTRARWLFFVGAAAAVGGISLWVLAWLG